MLNKLQIISLLCFISTLNLYATDRADEIKKLMWESDNPAFSITETPKKWKDESAVIIAKHHRFEYKKKAISSELRYKDLYHLRIKINDKNALNKYSEISFPSAYGENTVHTGFKIIKSDGSEHIIDNSEAVEMEAKTKKDKAAYKKIAISNLELGDILDYYIYEDNIIRINYPYYEFTPVQYYLPKEYPVMEQRIEFNAQRRCFIALNSTNGAPEFKLEVNKETDENFYTLVDRDREKVDVHRWFYPYRELPTIKFKVTYASKGVARMDMFAFLGKPGVAKGGATEDELITFLKDLVKVKFDVKDVKKYVKKKVGKKGTDIDKALWANYFKRNSHHRWEEVRLISDYKMGGSGNSYNELNNVKVMYYFLKSQKIPFELVVGVGRSIADLNDLLIRNEMSFGIRIKDGGEYFYMFPPKRNDFAGALPYDLINTEAYIVDSKKWTIKKELLTSSVKYPNAEYTQSTIHIDTDMQKCTIENVSSIIGEQKAYYQQSLLDYYDYIAEDEAHFTITKNFEKTGYSKKKLNALKESYLNDRAKRVANNLMFITENNYIFKVDTVNNFKFAQTGAYRDKPGFDFSYDIETEDLIHKAGRNYLLDIGKLIQSQVTIEKEELERDQNIYLYSPRLFNYTIKISLPDGYVVEGLDKLNINVDNDQGGFVSSAILSDRYIVVNTSKYYKQYFSEAETWKNYIAFLNAASKFTEQKLLIKKL